MGRRRKEGLGDLGEGVYPRANGIFELRYQVPEDVAYAFPGKDGSPLRQKIVSLGVRDPRLAKQYGREKRAEFDLRVHMARNERLDDRLSSYLRGIHSEATVALSALRDGERAKSRERLFGPPQGAAVGLKERVREARLAPVDEATWVADRVRWGRAASGNDPDLSVEQAAGREATAFFIDVLGRKPDPDSAEYKRVLSQCASAIADGVFNIVEQAEGRTPPPLSGAALSPSDTPDESVDGNRAIDSRAKLALSRYHEDVYLPVKTGEIEPHTIDVMRQSAKLFTALVGDPPLFLVRRADVTDFQEKLRHLPDGRKLTGELADKPLAEVVRMTMAGELKLPRQSASSIDKHVRNIKGVLSYAHEKGHVRLNPAVGIKNVKPTALNTAVKKRAFTRAELTRIWSQPLYAGCLKDNQAGLYQPGSLLIRDDRFWIPMLLFLTGARAMEVAGLAVDDVTIDGEADRLVFRHSKLRRLKNDESERVVPLHPWAAKMGFAEFYRSRKASGEAVLFSSVAGNEYRDGKTGELSEDKVSGTSVFRQFNRTILKHVGLTEKDTSLHSFRHTFEDAMTGKGIQEEAMSRLTGRAIVGSRSRYTSSLPHDPEKQKARAAEYSAYVSLIDFGGLNLDHLFTSE
jgi:integrase